MLGAVLGHVLVADRLHQLLFAFEVLPHGFAEIGQGIDQGEGVAGAS
jgi:hypothetical protein